MSPLRARFKGVYIQLRCWELNLVLWEEQCMLLTIEQFLQLAIPGFLFLCFFEDSYQELIVLEKARVKVAGMGRHV